MATPIKILSYPTVIAAVHTNTKSTSKNRSPRKLRYDLKGSESRDPTSRALGQISRRLAASSSMRMSSCSRSRAQADGELAGACGSTSASSVSSPTSSRRSSTASSRRSSSESCVAAEDIKQSPASRAERNSAKKRKFTTAKGGASRARGLSVETPATRKRRSILNEDEDMESVSGSSSGGEGSTRLQVVAEVSSSGRKDQISIANLISSPSTTANSGDESYAAATTAMADVQIKPEKLEMELALEDVDMDKKPVTTSTSASNIPAAFLATQAFASARDFFVSPQPSPNATDNGDMTPDKPHVVCTLCQVTMGNRVYSLKRHLFRHHPQVFRVASPVLNPKKLEPSLDMEPAMKLEPGVTSSHINKHSSASGQWMAVQLKHKHAASASASSAQLEGRRNDAFVDWLRSDVIPMRALHSPLFRDFLALVNPRFKLPQVIVQPQQLHKLGMSCPVRDVAMGSSVCESGPEGTGDNHLPRFMKAVCLQGNGLPPQLVTDLAVPTPGPNEALIQVLRAGICGTDLQMMANYKPGFKGALGHEFVGVVCQLGALAAADPQQCRRWLGRRVVGEINLPCDAPGCVVCTCGRSKSTSPSACTSDVDDNPQLSRAEIRRRNHCPNRTCLGIVGKDGAFAEYVTLPLANLHVVPAGVVDSHAVFAEPLAAACRVLEQQVVGKGDHVLVLGDGKLGLMVAEVLHAAGAAGAVTLVGRHQEKLALAKHCVTNSYCSTREEDTAELAERVLKEVDAPFDVCVESTGSPAGVALALRLLRRGGTLVMKSTCAATRSPVDLRAFQSKRLHVLGSRCGPIPWALRLLADRRVDVQKYIHGVYPLERADVALAHAARRGALKIQLIVR